MTHGTSGRIFTVKNLIRAAFTALSLSSIGVAHSQPASYMLLRRTTGRTIEWPTAGANQPLPPKVNAKAGVTPAFLFAESDAPGCDPADPGQYRQ
jgi:hypothetical protein